MAALCQDCQLLASIVPLITHLLAAKLVFYLSPFLFSQQIIDRTAPGYWNQPDSLFKGLEVPAPDLVCFPLYRAAHTANTSA